ncbi:hypothetical protein [Carp edema virus]|nr:hypothetical protein [Carp edema virus]
MTFLLTRNEFNFYNEVILCYIEKLTNKIIRIIILENNLKDTMEFLRSLTRVRRTSAPSFSQKRGYSKVSDEESLDRRGSIRRLNLLRLILLAIVFVTLGMCLLILSIYYSSLQSIPEEKNIPTPDPDFTSSEEDNYDDYYHDFSSSEEGDRRIGFTPKYMYLPYRNRTTPGINSTTESIDSGAEVTDDDETIGNFTTVTSNITGNESVSRSTNTTMTNIETSNTTISNITTVMPMVNSTTNLTEIAITLRNTLNTTLEVIRNLTRILNSTTSSQLTTMNSTLETNVNTKNITQDTLNQTTVEYITTNQTLPTNSTITKIPNIVKSLLNRFEGLVKRLGPST